MHWFWSSLKLLSGLVLVLGLCVIAMGIVFPVFWDRAGPLLWVVGLSGGVYWVSGRQLAQRRPVAVRPPGTWRGNSLIVQPRWGAHVALCLALSALVLGLVIALAKGAAQSGGEQIALGLGIVVSLWVASGAWAGGVRRWRAGHALRLDAAGVQYPGAPAVPWTAVRGVSIHPAVKDSESTPSLVLQLAPGYQRPGGLDHRWLPSLPGAQFARDSVTLPLFLVHEQPHQVLAAAQHLWQRATTLETR